MTTELIIALSLIIGLAVGFAINRRGIKDRDAAIKRMLNEAESNSRLYLEAVAKLEDDLALKQKVADTLNNNVCRLRRENERLRKKMHNDNETDSDDNRQVED